MLKKAPVMVLTLLLLQTLLFCVCPANSAAEEKAVNFSLMDLNNNKVSLSDFKDKPVMLFFWTTWCPYCRNELSLLNKKYSSLQEEDIEVLPIDIGETSSKVASFVKKYKLSYPVFLDKDTKVADAYKLLGVPTYIFINKKGQVSYRGNRFPRDYQKYILK